MPAGKLYWFCELCQCYGSIDETTESTPIEFIVDYIVRDHLRLSLMCAGVNGALDVVIQIDDYIRTKTIAEKTSLATEMPS